MKTTARHFGWFTDEAKRWIRFFGLYDWRVTFAHSRDYDYWDDDAIAMCCFTYDGRTATLWLNGDLPKEFCNEFQIRMSAFHEVVELLLGRISSIASTRWGFNQRDLTEATHEVVRTLENTVFGPEYAGRKQELSKNV